MWAASASDCRNFSDDSEVGNSCGERQQLFPVAGDVGVDNSGGDVVAASLYRISSTTYCSRGVKSSDVLCISGDVMWWRLRQLDLRSAQQQRLRLRIMVSGGGFEGECGCAL